MLEAHLTVMGGGVFSEDFLQKVLQKDKNDNNKEAGIPSHSDMFGEHGETSKWSDGSLNSAPMRPGYSPGSRATQTLGCTTRKQATVCAQNVVSKLKNETAPDAYSLGWLRRKWSRVNGS